MGFVFLISFTDIKGSLFPDWSFVNCAAKTFCFHAAVGAGESS